MFEPLSYVVQNCLCLFFTVTNPLIWIAPPRVTPLTALTCCPMNWLHYLDRNETHFSHSQSPVTVDIAQGVTDPWLWNLIIKKNGMRIFFFLAAVYGRVVTGLLWHWLRNSLSRRALDPPQLFTWTQWIVCESSEPLLCPCYVSVWMKLIQLRKKTKLHVKWHPYFPGTWYIWP